MDETHFSTQQYFSQTNSRVSQTHVDEERPQSDQRASCSTAKKVIPIAPDTQLGFSRRVRITKKREIDYVFRNATLRKSFGPIVITGVENSLGFPRLGLAIAKRYLHKAVSRNYVKRVIREWFRHNQTDIVCFDLMVSLRQRIVDPEQVHSWLSASSSSLQRSN